MQPFWRSEWIHHPIPPLLLTVMWECCPGGANPPLQTPHAVSVDKTTLQAAQHSLTAHLRVPQICSLLFPPKWCFKG